MSERYSNIPDEIKKLNNWLCWDLIEKNGRYTKVPKNPKSGNNASSTNPNTWSDFETALKASERHSGIGFVFTNSDYFGVDIDGIEGDIQKFKAGQKDNIVSEFVDTLQSYSEYSQSGKGIHIIARGEIPKGGNRKGQYEFYDKNSPRFFVMTGNVAGPYKEIREATDEVKALHSKYITAGKQKPAEAPAEAVDVVSNELSRKKGSKFSSDPTDDELLEIIAKSKQAARFNELYQGRWEAYFKSQSEADLSLLNMLAFWTNKDAARMDSFFRKSGLYRQEKWDRPQAGSTWGVLQIEKAIADTTDTFKPGERFAIVVESIKDHGDYRDLYGNFFFEEGRMKALVKKGDDEELKVFFDGYINITDSIVDLDEPNTIEYLALAAYPYGNGERKVIQIPKNIIGNEQKLIDLLNTRSGILVTGDNRSLMRRYLETQYRGRNQHRTLEPIYMTEQMGYFKYRKNGLKLDTFVFPSSQAVVSSNVVYKPEGAFNDIFQQSGNVVDWIQKIWQPIMGNINGFLYRLAAFASILIEPLETAENFIVDLSGSTTTGKTSLQVLAASVYGNENLIGDWNSTANSIISKAVQLRNLPLMLDDTKKASDKKIIAELLYQLSGGKEKGRSNIDGSYKGFRTFRNVTLTTGEVTILDYLSEGSSNGRGAYARVLMLQNGFLEQSNENGELLAELMSNARRYYGTIGLEWVKFIMWKLSEKNGLKELKDRYQAYRLQNEKKLKSDIARRQGNHLALLQLTYSLLLEYSILFENPMAGKHFNNMLDNLNTTSEEYDNYDQAYQALLEKLRENHHHFINDNDDDFTEATDLHFTETWGENKHDRYQIISKETIAKVIVKYGDVNDILKAWRQRGYLKASHNRMQVSARLRDGAIEKRYIIMKDSIDMLQVEEHEQIEF
jgi:uncharacterized protein (DUF927 family)